MAPHGIRRPAVLYWGGRRPRDLYLHELAQSWVQALPDFSYVPVVSDGMPEDGWTGRTGFENEAVLQDFPALSGYQVYACGAPPMVAAARRAFTAQGRLPAKRKRVVQGKGGAGRVDLR